MFLNLATGKVPVNDFVAQKINEHSQQAPGPVELRVNLEGATVQVEEREPIPLVGIIVKFEVVQSERHFQVTSTKVAELILHGFGDSDIIVFDEDLKRFKIDTKTGHVESV